MQYPFVGLIPMIIALEKEIVSLIRNNSTGIIYNIAIVIKKKNNDNNNAFKTYKKNSTLLKSILRMIYDDIIIIK